MIDAIDEISPYCSDCEACGEEGCCSPLMCKQSEKGDYCEKYLRDLKFGYRMYNDIMKLLEGDEKYKEQIDEIWERNYDKTYLNLENEL